jgi:hypothetical protein
MAYAVECFFNEEPTKQINKLIKIFKEQKINTDNIINPHISLAVYNSLDTVQFSEKLKIFSAKTHKIKLELLNFDIFSSEKSVLYLSPKFSKELFELHNVFHITFKKCIPNESHYYIPENWAPHCTIGIDMTKEMIDKSKKFMHEINLPLSLLIEEIGLIEFPPAKKIVSFPLESI